MRGAHALPLSLSPPPIDDDAPCSDVDNASRHHLRLQSSLSPHQSVVPLLRDPRRALLNPQVDLWLLLLRSQSHSSFPRPSPRQRTPILPPRSPHQDEVKESSVTPPLRANPTPASLLHELGQEEDAKVPAKTRRRLTHTHNTTAMDDGPATTDTVTPTMTSPSSDRNKATNRLSPFKLAVPSPAAGPALGGGLASDSAADSPAAPPQPSTTTQPTPRSSTSPSSASSTTTDISGMKPASRHMTRSASSEKDLSLQSATSVLGAGALDDINSNEMDVDVDATSESNLSDGDPPGYVDGNEVGSVPMKKRQTSASGGLPKRNFEELEEITFASPRSFQTMAFAIAATRGVDLQVTDDRTHKVTSAYMHITCSYRRSGCPFILKLTKAKEGGWVLKSSRATDVDPKQRSVYRCRHSAGATPDSPVSNARSALASPGETPYVEIPVIATSASTAPSSGTTTSHPGPSGTKPKAVRKRIKKDKHAEDESLFGKAPTARLAGFRTGGAKNSNNNGGPSSYLPSPDEGTRLHYLDDVGDRALAPPFERSNMLQSHISPALTAPHQHYPPLPPPPGSRSIYDADWGSSTSNARRSSANGNGSGTLPPPSAVYPQGSTYTSALSGFSNSAFAPSSQSSSRLPLTPLLAPPVPSNSLPQWTAFLTMLDKELTFLAPVLSSPGFSVTLASYFHETDSSEEMRVSLIDTLSDQDCPRWPRIKLMKLVKEKGLEVWEKVKEIEELGFDLMDGVVFEKNEGGGKNDAVKKRREKQKELERRDERPGPEEMRVDVKAFDGINGKPATTALLVGNASTKTDPSASSPPTPPSTSSDNPTMSKLALAKGLSSHYGSSVLPPTSSTTSNKEATTFVESQPPPPSSTLANVKQKIKPIAPAQPPPNPPTTLVAAPPAPSSPLSVATGMTHVISRTTVPSPGSATHPAWRDASMNSPLGFSSGPSSPHPSTNTITNTASSSTDKGKGKASPSPSTTTQNSTWSFDNFTSGKYRPAVSTATSLHHLADSPSVPQRATTPRDVTMHEVKKEDTGSFASLGTNAGTSATSPLPFATGPNVGRPSLGAGPVLPSSSSAGSASAPKLRLYNPWPMGGGSVRSIPSPTTSTLKSPPLTSLSTSTSTSNLMATTLPNPTGPGVTSSWSSNSTSATSPNVHAQTPLPSPFNLLSASLKSPPIPSPTNGISTSSGQAKTSGGAPSFDYPTTALAGHQNGGIGLGLSARGGSGGQLTGKGDGGHGGEPSSS